LSKTHPVTGKVVVADDIGLALGIDNIRADHTLAAVLDQAKFMEEVCDVYVHSGSNETDPGHFILNVNGINQPVFRGQVTPMRRKYLEVLARMKETKFSQPARDSGNPEPGNALIPRTMQVHPFEVRNDPNRLGPAWLRQILAEAA